LKKEAKTFVYWARVGAGKVFEFQGVEWEKQRTERVSSMKRYAALAIMSLCAIFTNIAGSQASLAALPCNVDFFFNKGSGIILTTTRFAGKDVDLIAEAEKKFHQYNDDQPESLFYVTGDIGGQEDMSTDHRIATARALAVQAWLRNRGVPSDRIFAYAIVPVSQTPYGHGGAEVLFCNKKCPCKPGFDQRGKILDRDEYAPQYPLDPQ
jgi:hypothetical protein